MLLGTEGESVLPPSGLEEDSSALSALTYFNLPSRQRKVLPPLKTSKAGNQWRRRSYLEADCVILLGQSESHHLSRDLIIMLCILYFPC